MKSKLNFIAFLKMDSSLEKLIHETKYRSNKDVQLLLLIMVFWVMIPCSDVTTTHKT